MTDGIAPVGRTRNFPGTPAATPHDARWPRGYVSGSGELVSCGFFLGRLLRMSD